MVTVITKGTNPITLDRAKEHLRVTHTREDELIQVYLNAAYSAAKQYTWREIAVTEVREMFDNLSETYIPCVPLNTDESYTVEYLNESDVWIEVDYEYDVKRKELYLTVAKPTDISTTKRNPVRVTYSTGFTEVPEDIITAILLLCNDYYDNRGDMLDQVFNIDGKYIRSSRILMNPWRLKGF